MRFISSTLKAVAFSLIIILSLNSGHGIDQAQEESPLLDSKKGIYELHQVHAQTTRTPVWPLERNVPINLRYFDAAKLREDCEREFSCRSCADDLPPHKVGLFCVMNLSSTVFAFASYQLQPQMFYLFASMLNDSEIMIPILNENIVFIEAKSMDKIIGVHTFGIHYIAAPTSSSHVTKFIVFGENASLDDKTKEDILIKFNDYSKNDRSIKLNALLIPQFGCYLEDPVAYAENLKSKKMIYVWEEMVLIEGASPPTKLATS